MTLLKIAKPVSWKPGWLHIIIVLTLMQLFVALLTNGFAFSQEEAIWHYIGRNWFRNDLVPYNGGADNKSPLFYVIFGLSDLLFGVNYWFPRVLGTVVQSLGIFYVYKIAAHISGKQAGLFAISLYGLSVLWHGADGRYVSFTETYGVFFAILSFYLLLVKKNDRGSFFSGFFAVVSLGFRLSGLFILPALLIASAQKGINFTLVFCLGLLSGVVALAISAYLAGISFHDIFFFMVTDNFGPGSINNNGLVWRISQFNNLFFYSEVILFYPLVLVYIFIKRKADWLVLWLIFGFIGINVVGNYARVDLKELVPAMSLMGGFSLAHFSRLYRLPFQKIMLIIWICFSPKTLEPFVNFFRLFSGQFQFAQNFCHEPYIQPDESASKQLGLWVKANTNTRDKVYVAGYGSQVQAYSERLSPSIYFNVTQTGAAKERLFLDMKKTKADMILVPLFPDYKQWVGEDLRVFIDQLLAKDYYFDGCMFNYVVYKLKKAK